MMIALNADLAGDLVFDPKLPSFELDLERIKKNILSKIHDDCFKMWPLEC